MLELVSLLLADDLACMNRDKFKSRSAPSLEPNTDRGTERLTNNSLNSNLQIVVHDLLPHDESDAIFPRHAGVFDVLHQPAKNAIKQACAINFLLPRHPDAAFYKERTRPLINNFHDVCHIPWRTGKFESKVKLSIFYFKKKVFQQISTKPV